MLWHYTTGQPDLSEFVTEPQLAAVAATANGAATTANNAQTAANSANSGLSNLITDLGNGTANVAAAAINGTLSPNNVASGMGLSNLAADVQSLLGLGTSANTQAINANTQIAALLAEQNGSTSNGNSFTDNFNRADSTGLGSNWTPYLSGSGIGRFSVVSDLCTWGYSGTYGGPANDIEIYTNGQTLTDYQNVSLVLSSLPTWNIINGNAQNSLIGRSNSAGTTFVEARLTSDGNSPTSGNLNLGVYACVAGTYTQLGSTQTVSCNAGDLWSMQMGTAGNVLTFQVLKNGVIQYTVTDTGAVSQHGASYRYGGQKAYTPYVGYQSNPGNVTIWTLSDNVPSTISGTGWWIYRASTAASPNTGVTAATGSICSANVFDTVQYASPGITVPSNLATTLPGIQVAKSGWYSCSFAYYLGLVSISFTTKLYQMGFKVVDNLTSLTNLSRLTCQSTAFATTNPITLMANAVFYVQAGNFICPAFYQPSGGTIGAAYGDSLGQNTYFTGSLVSP